MNKRNLLIVLGVVWVFILVYNFGLFGAGKGGGESDSRLKHKRQVVAAKDFPSLQLDQLQEKRPSYKKVRKDIFSPFSNLSKGGKRTVVAPAVAAVPIDPLEKLISELSFIGFVENAREKTIFLGMGDDVLLIRKGVTVAGLARVIEITDRKVIFGNISGGAERLFEISLE